jgi:Flp pilus assembly protein TadG
MIHLRGSSIGVGGRKRRAAAAAELGLVAPVLLFTMLIAADFARVFYYYVTINSCARSGALYGCQNPTNCANTSGIQASAKKDASGLSPQPSVPTPTTGTDTSGNPYVSVTVTYSFTTLVNYPGIPHTFNLSRTVQMRVCQSQPNAN